MSARIEPVKTEPEDNQQVTKWLAAQLNDRHPYLLAFADDGVIWGRLVDGRLKTSHDIDSGASPELMGETLQQAFVFGPEEEIRLFHDELGNWKALCVKDGDPLILECQILWGDKLVESTPDGFSKVKDTTKGIPDQIIPLEIKSLTEKECIRLDIHHFVEFDEKTGEARISLSRLAGLRVGSREEVVR